MVKLDIRMLHPLLKLFDVGWILLIVRNIPGMRVAGDDFVEGKYNAFHVISVLSVPNATDPATIVEVEQHKSVRLGVDKKIPRGYILVGDAVLEIQVVDHASQLPEPL
ncbi:hypothetical protein MFIFM68171_02568 [Madurella fahalii]|uniref:Uncharacterized protein n=1 Tax=Madurella fahalii TaxID=1157608 RepID=A0ABQ0G3M3_9PEZI